MANHFTRIETLFLTYHIYRLIEKKPVWSLAAGELYTASLGSFLERVGALSTQNPDRDRLIVKSLLTGEAAWVIYPEGRMVKNKKIFDKGRFLISHGQEKHSPHTGAASLALRTEFYRQRLKALEKKDTDEVQRLLQLFQIEPSTPIDHLETYIVPVNLTYYPIRAKENLLNYLADHFVDHLSDRMEEELMAEGTMLFSGVDIDIRFGPPIPVASLLDHAIIKKDIESLRPFAFDDVLPSTAVMRNIARKQMLRYMAAIYHMTTINPEHLFAGMLRHIRGKTFGAEELKQRVFLAASGLTGSNIFYHRDLEKPPVHLFVDDKRQWFDHFIQLAIEKKVVREQKGRFVKNQKMLTTLFDFHRVRVENPIKVMVNEIEPMRSLQKRLRKIAYSPGFWIKRQVMKKLQQLAEEEFENDYETFFIEDESKPKHVGAPIFLKGRRAKTGILLIHGYMAAPMEVAALAEYLNGKGWWVYAPRVKGHGTSPEDLGMQTKKDWIESVELGYTLLSLACPNVIIGGFSAGGGLALELASRQANIKAVFAICPPFKLHAATVKLAPAMDMWNRLVGRVRPRMTMKFVENHPENPEINYHRNPISGVRQLEQLMENVKDKADNIKQRAMLILADKDPVVDDRGARKFFDRLGSSDKQLLLYHFDRHGIIRGENAGRIHRAVAHFIKTTEIGSAPPHNQQSQLRLNDLNESQSG